VEGGDLFHSLLLLRNTSTMNAIVPTPPGAALPAALAPDLTRAAELAREEKAASTRRAYRSDFRIFQAMVPGPRCKRTAGRR
jgi:hypothetical protein